MDLSQLHFSHPNWLWGTIVVPLVWVIFFLFYYPRTSFRQLDKFVDNHLLPYLIVDGQQAKKQGWKTLLLWSVVWFSLVFALAGPRWSFREIEMMSKDQSLVVLLDLSESMNSTDIKPSRLVRAKQKIEDLINLSKGLKIGLIAFAADPHMITPITDDKETIRRLLPSLETDLIHVQGSRLAPALEMASVMLQAEPGNNQALLIISDGDFEDGSAITAVKKLADKGIIIHVMGIGTLQGAVLQDHQGNIIKKNGVPIVSKLVKNKMEDISKIGYGNYFEGHYSNQEELIILQGLEKRAEAMQVGKKNRLWDERFYLLILPVLPIVLWWFRKGIIFAGIIILLAPSFAQAGIVDDYFKNSEERGKCALEHGEYDSASNTFQDPYRKGVAYYKAGDFAEAEKMFRQSTREEVACEAAYNLGNALVQQQQLKKAATVYEDVLKKWPDHQKAKDNLALVKEMMEQQKEQSSDSDDSSENEEQDQKDSDVQSKKPNSKTPEDQEQKNKDSQSNHSKPEKKPNGNDFEDKSDKTEQDHLESSDKEQSPKNENGRDTEEQKKQEKQQAELAGQDTKEENNSQANEQDKNGNEENPPLQKEASKEEKEISYLKSQEDQDADAWLNRLSNDPKKFLKNKFYIESKKNGTMEGIDPW